MPGCRRISHQFSSSSSLPPCTAPCWAHLISMELEGKFSCSREFCCSPCLSLLAGRYLWGELGWAWAVGCPSRSTEQHWSTKWGRLQLQHAPEKILAWFLVVFFFHRCPHNSLKKCPFNALKERIWGALGHGHSSRGTDAPKVPQEKPGTTHFCIYGQCKQLPQNLCQNPGRIRLEKSGSLWHPYSPPCVFWMSKLEGWMSTQLEQFSLLLQFVPSEFLCTLHIRGGLEKDRHLVMKTSVFSKCIWNRQWHLCLL